MLSSLFGYLLSSLCMTSPCCTRRPLGRTLRSETLARMFGLVLGGSLIIGGNPTTLWASSVRPKPQRLVPQRVVLQRILPAPSAETQKNAFLSRAQVIAFAIKQHPKLREMRAKVHAALRYWRGTRIFPTNPTLESTGKLKGKPETSGFKVAPYTVEVELHWKMPIGGRWTRRQALALASLKRLQAEYNAAKMTLLFKVHKACNDILIARETERLYERLYAFYQRIVKFVLMRQKRGVATALDINLARMELLQTQADLLLARAQSKLALQQLVEAIGWNQPQPPAFLDNALPNLLPSTPLPAMMQFAKKHHPLVLIAQNQLKEARASLAFENAKAIPDLKFKLYYAFEADDQQIMGFGLSMPIPILSRNQPKVWKAHASIQQARLALQATQFTVLQRIQQTFIRYSASYRVFKLYEQQLIPTFQQQLQLREKGLLLGSFTILQVIAAQQSQNKALLKRIKSLKDTLAFLLALQYATGILP